MTIIIKERIMKEAFNYMFKDNLFKQKWAAYFCFAFLGAFVTNLGNSPVLGSLKIFAPLFLILGIIILFIPTGYIVACIRALSGQKENYLLPGFNYKHNMFTGFKFWVAVLILSLIFGIGCTVISAVIAVIAGILKAKVFAIVGITFVMVFPILIIAYYALALNKIFADTDSWTSFIKFKQATAMIKQSSHYNKWFLIFIVLNGLLGIISGVLSALGAGSIGWLVITTLISAMLASYVAFVNAFITAKCIE